MCETLYNPEYYPSLAKMICHCLKKAPEAKVLVGTKTFYFGLSGGYFDFEQYLVKNHSTYGLVCKTEEKLNDMKSIERLVVSI
mmetsp:Transcript_23051/g.35664  ORF Transcript_23051/g.35664 Transcript_23051/m.35664 type:complete len:83 (+) Transcript_23051:507-755(+)